MNKNPLDSIAAFFSAIFGRFSWSSPTWLTNLCQRMRSRPSFFKKFLIADILIVIAIIVVYQWYKHLPHPNLITAQITQPKITPSEEELVPDTLLIDFGTQNGSFTTKSVAPLSMLYKEVPKGITLTPALPGKWIWQTDSELAFTPEKDWPAGQTYQVHFDKTLFAPGTKLGKLDYSFSTLPFEAKIAEFKFYQDPVDPQLKQVVATLQFNYPVDSNSLEKKVTLIEQGSSTHYKFQITYDKYKRTAYLHSESLTLPKNERYLELILNKGIQAGVGPGTTADRFSQTVLIPNASSYFKINNVTATIVHDDRDRPEQVLTLETTVGATEAGLNKALHVYLLPQDYPASSAEEAKTNYQWQNPGEVTPNILALATPLSLQAIPTEQEYSMLHSYRFNAETPRFIYLKVDKGVQGFGNYTLTDDYIAIVKVPEYPKEIGFLHKGALLALSSEKKFSVIVRGLEAVKFQIARVLPDDVNHLITQTQGNFSDPRFINTSFNQNNISEIFSEVQQFNSGDPSKAQYTALDLGKYLAAKTNKNGPLGLFLLQATGWNVAEKTPLDDVKNNRLILITDLGLLVKDNKDDTHDVFVESITTGQPVANVKVDVLGKNGLPIATRTTDIEGHANFTTLEDFIDDQQPTVYLATLGNDVSFIPYNNLDRQLNYSKFDIGGVTSFSDQDSQKLTAYVFSDRGIYRPGDTAHLAMIVKQLFAEPQPAGLPLQVTITDPRGTTVKDLKTTLDATGLFTIDFVTDPTSPTGQYTVSLYTVKDNQPSNLLGSTTFRVAEFLPDRMRITTHLSAESPQGWINPTDLTAKVGLWNLYGAPAVNRKISAKILLEPHKVQFASYPNYTFVDPLVDPNKPAKVFTETLADTTTNDQGQAELNLNLTRFDKATYQLTVFTEGFEAEGGRSVTTQNVALVSPLAYLIGYHPDGDLRFIKQNDKRSVNFIAINSQLKKKAVDNLKIQLQALHPVTSLVKNQNGTYQYKSLIQTSVINTTPFKITDQGTDFVLPADKIGDFAVVVLDQSNTELSKVKFSIVGASQLPLAKNAELTLKLNKTEYASDEDIELQINAPYTGSGLITIERDKVYAYQWFKADTNNSVHKIHIPKDFLGNGYVNVTFIRDWNSPEIFTSPLSFSAAPFTVNHESHAIHIDLMTPVLAMPGQPFVMNYKTDKPGKIIVFAVDEGILQVANYQTPDPLDFFFQKRALEVLTQQTVDLILPKFIADRELSAVGGDGGEAVLRNNLNPFKRKTDLPVVYWSGILDTDATPRQLTYNIPDYFNGTLRVMAVAVANNAIGSASKSTEVRGHFVINPNVPTFVAPGDEFEITASIANNVKDTGKDAPVNVQLNVSPELKILGDTQQRLAITEGQEQTVRFKLRATHNLGSAQVTFVVNNGNKSSKMNATLSVRPENAYSTSIISGKANDASKTLTLDRIMYPEYRKTEAVLSTSPLILIMGLQRYLDNYPFGCTEQLVSKAMPLLALASQPTLAEKPQVITDKVQATIQMLGQRQLSSGGFSYWPNVGDNSNTNFASVYAMQFLMEARAHGYNVPSEMYHAGISYLKAFAAQDVSSLDEARIQAYAIYILTANEIVTTNYLTHLQLYLDKDPKHAWKKDITSAYLAATYQLLKSYNTANQLITGFKPKFTADDATTDFYSNNVANAQYLYLLARHFPDRLPELGKDLISPLITAMNDNEINTVFSGFASLALTAYSQYYQTHTAMLSLHEILDDGKEKSLVENQNNFIKSAIDANAKKVIFINPSKQDYFFQLIQAGFDKKPSDKVIKEGMEVAREFRDADGNLMNETKLGNEITVHLQVRSLNTYLSNIAIVDLLPGGFEVVRDSVKTDNVDYADVREDRVIFFTGVNPDAKEIVYRIKATNQGKYSVPPIMATSMYNPGIRAQSAGGNFFTIK